MPEIEISDREYARNLRSKRLKDLLAAVKSIKLPEAKQVDLSPIITKIEQLTNAFLEKTNEIGNPKVVVQKSEINQTEIVNSLSELIKEIKDLKSSMNKPSKQKNWVFDVVRNSQGFIQSVNVKQE